MLAFRDKQGRSWEPEVNVVTIGRVRLALGINLLELLLQANAPDDNGTLAERLSDPCLLVDVLYLLCKDQADRLGITDDDFGRSMTPDGIEDGWGAVLEGIVSFSPRGLRPAHQRILEKARAYQRAAEAKIEAMVTGTEFDRILDQAMEAAVQRQPNLQTASTGAASSLPVSSESNPAETL